MKAKNLLFFFGGAAAAGIGLTCVYNYFVEAEAAESRETDALRNKQAQLRPVSTNGTESPPSILKCRTNFLELSEKINTLLASGTEKDKIDQTLVVGLSNANNFLSATETQTLIALFTKYDLQKSLVILQATAASPKLKRKVSFEQSKPDGF